MKKALIAGVGNVLLGDDGVGPYVVRLLESLYSFGDDVEVADLGTPALDLTHRISGIDTLVVVDSVADRTAVGKILLYRKTDLIAQMPAQRLDPHSPALAECLLAAEMLGSSPEHVLLVGIPGESYQPGASLSASVRQAVEPAIMVILSELQRLGFEYQKRLCQRDPAIWWVAKSRTSAAV